MNKFNEGDTVAWYCNEDNRVYHGFVITHTYTDNEYEISHDDEGIFYVNGSELEYDC